MKNRAHLFSAFASDGLPESGVPEWIHLLPAGTFSSWDGRGPFTVSDPAKLIAASMARGALPIDQDHATDNVAKTGVAAPARGWIVEMQARADGIWGRVEWTGEGKALLSDRAYRGISPVILFDESKCVQAIRRAALTNDPALDQLTTVFSGNPDMDFKAKLIELLGLTAEASDEDILAALKTAADADPGGSASMSAQLTEGGEPAGHALELITLSATVAALKSKVSELETTAATNSANALRAEAMSAVDAAITEGKPIKPQRETWISLFVSDPDKTKAALAAMPSINGPAIEGDDEKGGKAQLSADETKAVELMGLKVEDFIAARDEGK